jgi:hypothetical protein
MKVIIEVKEIMVGSNKYMFTSNGRSYIFYKDEVQPLRERKILNWAKAKEEICEKRINLFTDFMGRFDSDKAKAEAYGDCIKIIETNIRGGL